LVRSTLSGLSNVDREYVAAVIGETAPRTETVLHRTADRMPLLAMASRWFTALQLRTETKPSLVPATLVYVRVSHDFLEDYVDRNVRQTKPVTDCVLGTRIQGESETIGKTHMFLRDSDDR